MLARPAMPSGVGGNHPRANAVKAHQACFPQPALRTISLVLGSPRTRVSATKSGSSSLWKVEKGNSPSQRAFRTIEGMEALTVAVAAPVLLILPLAIVAQHLAPDEHDRFTRSLQIVTDILRRRRD